MLLNVKIYLVIIINFFDEKSEIEVDHMAEKFPRLFGLLHLVVISFAL